MKNSLIYIVLLAFMAIITSCSNSGDKDPCSSASNIDDAKCQKNIPTTGGGTISLDMAFKDSFFYYGFEKEWKTISKSNLEGGVAGVVIPIYSSFLNKDAADAVDEVLIAGDQKQNPSRYQEADFNVIPYIEVQYEPGLQYVYNYVKKNLNGDPVASVTGRLIVKNNRAILPLVNAMFNNQFYSPTDLIGKRYIHSISVSAQSVNQQSSAPKRFEFESILQIPIVDFYVDYSSAIRAFTMKDRFNNFFAGGDGLPNQNLHFYSLKQNTQPEAVQVDLKVLFKTRPKIVIEQELFFENPIDIDKFKTTGEITPARGESFYTEKVELDSENHFRMKVVMNGVTQNLTDGREFVVQNLPAGVPWNIDFFYDLRTNAAFSSPTGQPLITPYKPTCSEITGAAFTPLASAQEKAQATQLEGFLSVCHPDLNQKVVLTRADLATTQISLTDTFNSFFNYIPQDNIRNVTGHFNGLRTITFRMEGCVRVYVKTPTSSDFELKSATSQACVGEGETNSDGWLYFTSSRTFTISGSVADYQSIPGLVNLIQSFSTKPIKRTPNFKFNGLINDLRHIY